METLVERCAGLDVHKNSVVVCLRLPGHEGRGRTGEIDRRANQVVGLPVTAEGDPGSGASDRLG